MVAFFRGARLVFGRSHAREIAEIVDKVGLIGIAVIQRKLGPIDLFGAVDSDQNLLEPPQA